MKNKNKCLFVHIAKFYEKTQMIYYISTSLDSYKMSLMSRKNKYFDIKKQ